MENEVERLLNFLKLEQLAQVEVLVTDRRRQINKWLREKHPEFTHFYNMWHVVKGTEYIFE